MAYGLTQEQVTVLLGRPLTTIEASSFTVYIDIAKMRLSDLVCFDITDPAQYEDSATDIPNDLALVWARLFGGISSESLQQRNGGIASKRVEDFQISYRDGFDPLSELINLNYATIAKYSKCGNGIRHGRTLFEEERRERI